MTHGEGEAPGSSLSQVLERYFKQHPDQVYLWRREGETFVLQDFNEEAERVSRGGLRSLLGRDVRAVAAGSPEALEAMERAWREGSVVPIELRYRYASTGRERDLHVVYVPVPPAHLVAQAVDVTEVVDTARSLRERGEELEAHRERLRALAAYQDKVREEERLRLSRELHDELGQRLTVLHLDAQRLLAGGAPDPGELAALTEGLREAMEVTRAISRRLRPSVLDELGVTAALEWQLRSLRERLGIGTSLHVPDDEPELPSEVAAGLFRIAQEALTNAARHAHPQGVEVRLEADEEDVVLTVSDDGVGFDADGEAGPGLGLLIMRERAAALGGRLEVRSEPGDGCAVEVRVPRRARVGRATASG